MWFFKKKNTADLDLSWLKTDMHSHLVPGIDDGAPDTTTSLSLIKGLEDAGFSKLITTPHIYWEFYPNTAASITTAAAALRSQAPEPLSENRLAVAAEYFLDEHFESLLDSRAPLLCIKDNEVLVEFSMITAKLDLQDLLFKIQIAGFQPVIAHAERYTYLHNRKGLYDELKSMGCLFQLNLLSLTGYYGRQVADLAEYLVKKNYYDYAGTDLHHERQLAALQKLAGNKLLETLKESGTLRNTGL